MLGGLDAATISSILIGLSGLVGWLYTQSQSKSRDLRNELRWRRHLDAGRTRYIYRLEERLRSLDMELPEKPEELIRTEKEEW